MDWRERAYKTYFEHYLKGERSKLDKESVNRQFPIWDKYYGVFLPSDKTAAILDLGCGSGELLFWLQNRGFKNASGVDYNEDLVRESKKLGAQNVQKADMRELLKNKPESFNCIIARDVLEHFTKEEIFGILDAVHAAIRPGGIFIAQTPNAESPFGARSRYYDFTHCVGFTPSSLRHVLRASGFKDIVFKEMGPVPHGLTSSIRFVLWRFIVLVLRVYLLVETGSAKGIFTQNMIVRAIKAQNNESLTQEGVRV